MNKITLVGLGLVILAVLIGAASYMAKPRSLLQSLEVGRQSAATQHGSVSSCTLTTDKKYYELGEPVTFTWTSVNAPSVVFDQDYRGPAGSAMPALPTAAFPPKGSTSFTPSAGGYIALQMKTQGNAAAACGTVFFVGNGQKIGKTTVGQFARLPFIMIMTKPGDTENAESGAYSFELEETSHVTNPDGTTAQGHAVLDVHDGSADYPVFLIQGQPQDVHLSRITMRMLLDFKDRNTVITVTDPNETYP